MRSRKQIEKAIRNAPVVWAVLAIISGVAAYASVLSRAPAPLVVVVSVVAVVMCIRLVRVCVKRVQVYRDSPARFCRGKGIEIGSGAHPMVSGSLLVDIVDDFSSEMPYKVDYITDAHDLRMIDAGSLDYVCASHVLEHLTDPIKALREWLRVLKPGGIIWLRIPDKRKMFDRNRQRTHLSHLIEDHTKGVGLDDPTHIDDANRNSDPPRDEKPPYLHHHVWVPEDIAELISYISKTHVPAEVVTIQECCRKNAVDFFIVVRRG